MIKEYLAQLHILNAIEVAVYRLQMNVFYDKRLHKIIIFKSESGKKKCKIACKKQHNMQWLYKLYLEQKKGKNVDIVQSKL